MTVVADNRVDVALQVRPTRVVLDVEAEVVAGPRRTRVQTRRVRQDEVTTARDEVRSDCLRDGHYRVIQLRIAGVVTTDDSADRVGDAVAVSDVRTPVASRGTDLGVARRDETHGQVGTDRGPGPVAIQDVEADFRIRDDAR